MLFFAQEVAWMTLSACSREFVACDLQRPNGRDQPLLLLVAEEKSSKLLTTETRGTHDETSIAPGLDRETETDQGVEALNVGLGALSRLPWWHIR